MPEQEPKVVYLCSRRGEGIAVPLNTEPGGDQLFLACGMVCDCESANGECPQECELKKLAEQRGSLARYKEMLGGFDNVF